MANTFSTRGNAVSALRKNGLSLVPHTIRKVRNDDGVERFEPVFLPPLAEDRAYLRGKGWAVEAPAPAAVAERVKAAIVAELERQMQARGIEALTVRRREHGIADVHGLVDLDALAAARRRATKPTGAGRATVRRAALKGK